MIIRTDKFKNSIKAYITASPENHDAPMKQI